MSKARLIPTLFGRFRPLERFRLERSVAYFQSQPAHREVARRRTFAIISHPDAGKTTLTEKLLLFGGAIQLAGEVKARREPPRAARTG